LLDGGGRRFASRGGRALRLVWAQLALSDRDDIFTHIEAENPRSAVMSTSKSSMRLAVSSTFWKQATRSDRRHASL
jgi:hypothetical protein